jgi:hypothetical protein
MAKALENREIWIELQKDVFDYGFQAEFCEFFLEHPDLNIKELDRQFRDEWDINLAP